jgi:hypothetical protein
MTEEVWYLSRDEETFNDGPYPTREAAIAAAPDEGFDPGDSLWVGRAVPASSLLSAANVVQMLNDHAYDDGPEGNDGYEVSTEAQEELDAMLRAWADKHNIKPTWWGIEDVSHHVVPLERTPADEVEDSAR